MAERCVGRLSVPNDTRHLAEVRGFVRGVLDGSPFDEKTSNLIVLAVDEAVANVMEHAYDPGSNGSVNVEAYVNEATLAFVVEDHGKPFDPRSVGEVDMDEHVKAKARDGLGMLMIRRIMDDIEYDYSASRNRLRLVKALPRPA